MGSSTGSHFTSAPSRVIDILMSEETVRPLFHYTYKHDGVILDQQYNYQGNMLAVSNSNGEIFFYSAEGEEQNRDPLYSNDRKRGVEKKSAAILKIAWSLPIFGYFASASINREIDLYLCGKSSITEIICRKVDYLPLSLAFCPSETELLLAVGLSDGSVTLFNEKLEEIFSVCAHEQAVNCLAWEHNILSYEKNKWIMDNFAHMKRMNSQEEPSLLISGSSDCWVKVWKWNKGVLSELYRLRAHQKPIREVQWRPTYLLQTEKNIITCSEDGFVSIWRIRGNALEIKETRNFMGPVYKASFNFLGNMIAISYCNESEERIETVIMREKNGALMGEEIKVAS